MQRVASKHKQILIYFKIACRLERIIYEVKNIPGKTNGIYNKNNFSSCSSRQGWQMMIRDWSDREIAFVKAL